MNTGCEGTIPSCAPPQTDLDSSIEACNPLRILGLPSSGDYRTATKRQPRRKRSSKSSIDPSTSVGNLEAISSRRPAVTGLPPTLSSPPIPDGSPTAAQNATPKIDACLSIECPEPKPPAASDAWQAPTSMQSQQPRRRVHIAPTLLQTLSPTYKPGVRRVNPVLQSYPHLEGMKYITSRLMRDQEPLTSPALWPYTVSAGHMEWLMLLEDVYRWLEPIESEFFEIGMRVLELRSRLTHDPILLNDPIVLNAIESSLGRAFSEFPMGQDGFRLCSIFHDPESLKISRQWFIAKVHELVVRYRKRLDAVSVMRTTLAKLEGDTECKEGSSRD